MHTVGRTEITGKLAIRAGFGTLLHHRIVFRVIDLFLLSFSLLSERISRNEGKHQSYRSSDSGHSVFHGKFPFPCIGSLD